MKRIIKTEKENKVALAFVERLMTNDPTKDSEEGLLLSLLATQIQIFEKRYDSSLSPLRKECSACLGSGFVEGLTGFRNGKPCPTCRPYLEEMEQAQRNLDNMYGQFQHGNK